MKARRPAKGSEEAKQQMARVRAAQLSKALANHPVPELRVNAVDEQRGPPPHHAPPSPARGYSELEERRGGDHRVYQHPGHFPSFGRY